MLILSPFSDNSSRVEYHRTRNGPNWFLVYYKNAAQIRFTPKEVGRCFGVAMFTPTVNNIREWCYEMVEKYGSEEDKSTDDYKNYIKKHGFGPEVHDGDESSPEEPNETPK